MNFNVKALMKSNPDFHIKGNLDPISFNTDVHGSMRLGVGKLSIHIGKIPIKARIPFLKKQSEPKTIGVIGGFDISVDPFSLGIDGAQAHIDGVIGPKGITGEMDCSVKCTTVGSVKGEATDTKAKIKLILEDEESDNDDSSHSCRRD